MDDLNMARRALCERHHADFVDTPVDAIVGVSDNVVAGAYPLNGLRHARGTTSGWFIWAGDRLGDEPDFFKPLHAEHLAMRCPEVLRWLGLGEGWRFLTAPEHEDAWFDPAILGHSV
jgi:hypothetical protein